MMGSREAQCPLMAKMHHVGVSNGLPAKGCLRGIQGNLKAG